MSDVHETKVRWLQANQGLEQIGVVLAHPNGPNLDIAIVAGAAVRWLTRDEWWQLMHRVESEQ